MDDDQWTDEPVPIPPLAERQRAREGFDAARFGWWVLFLVSSTVAWGLAFWLAMSWLR
jgi:hypothetical protein